MRKLRALATHGAGECRVPRSRQWYAALACRARPHPTFWDGQGSNLGSRPGQARAGGPPCARDGTGRRKSFPVKTIITRTFPAIRDPCLRVKARSPPSRPALPLTRRRPGNRDSAHLSRQPASHTFFPWISGVIIIPCPSLQPSASFGSARNKKPPSRESTCTSHRHSACSMTEAGCFPFRGRRTRTRDARGWRRQRRACRPMQRHISRFSRGRLRHGVLHENRPARFFGLRGRMNSWGWGLQFPVLEISTGLSGADRALRLHTIGGLLYPFWPLLWGTHTAASGGGAREGAVRCLLGTQSRHHTFAFYSIRNGAIWSKSPQNLQCGNEKMLSS